MPAGPAVDRLHSSAVLQDDRVRLRAPTPDDAAVLHEINNIDPETHLIADDAAFVPRSVDFVRRQLEKRLDEDPDTPRRGVVMLAEALDGDGGPTVIGEAVLWGIDQFNRVAHIGIGLLPQARGKGYGTAIVGLTCKYGFRYHNMRRLELETLSTNQPMCRAALANGFVREGTLRERSYDGNGYTDLALFGLLRTEWSGASDRA
jgi:RimJ/RimL family protein N-acetyltransferase